MAITEQTRDYEILIRINADGTVGAQRQTITEIIRDGEVIAATLGEPMPVTAAEIIEVLQ